MSILIKFDQWGRLGNRMFQYAFGKILSQEKSASLYHDEIPNFNISPNKTNIFENYITTRSLGLNKTDKNILLNTNKNILIDSFLQKHYYYTPYRDLLIKSFNISYNIEIENSLKNTLVIHYRETDYKDLKVLPNLLFYEKFLSNINFNKIIICTDNSSCEGVRYLLSKGCILASEGVVNEFKTFCDQRGMDDFNIMLHSSNLLISQSTFSWWAAFLGIDKKIYFPFYNNGMWKKIPEEDDIDLFFNFGNSEKVIYNDV